MDQELFESNTTQNQEHFEPRHPSITPYHKICILPPSVKSRFSYSQIWVTKREQGDITKDFRIANYTKAAIELSFAYGFGVNTIFTQFKKRTL